MYIGSKYISNLLEINEYKICYGFYGQRDLSIRINKLTFLYVLEKKSNSKNY